MRSWNTIMTEPNESFPLANTDELILRVFRHIGAAYETGDADCWDAAHGRADRALGRDAGSMLVARAASIVRLIRVDRPDFAFLPMPCRALSRDETALLHLLRAARLAPALLDRDDFNMVEHDVLLKPEPAFRHLALAAARILDDVGSIGLLAAAACALVAQTMPSIAPGSLHAMVAQGARADHVLV